MSAEALMLAGACSAAAALARALAFPMLLNALSGHSQRFWWVSSGLCLQIGALHAWGTFARRDIF